MTAHEAEIARLSINMPLCCLMMMNSAMYVDEQCA